MTVAQEMTCSELVELVTDYFEGTLSREDRKRFQRHISECDSCTEYVEQMRTTVRVLGRLSEESVPPEVRDELLRAFQGWKAGG